MHAFDEMLTTAFDSSKYKHITSRIRFISPFFVQIQIKKNQAVCFPLVLPLSLVY